MAQLVAEKCGVKVVFALTAETEQKGCSKAKRAILNTTKIEQLCWKAQVEIEEGIRRTIEILRGKK